MNSYQHVLDKETGSDNVAGTYFQHASAPRVCTDTTMLVSIENAHPGCEVTIVPEGESDLLKYAERGYAIVNEMNEKTRPSNLKNLVYKPPARKLDNDQGSLQTIVLFQCYLYQWEGLEFVLYLVSGRDGSGYYPVIRSQFVVGAKKDVERLVMAAGRDQIELREEIWVFDLGMWQKDQALFQSVKKASWEDVILDSGMKKELIDTIDRFYDSRSQYEKLKVPWKRGLIFYGPPGNGKTISIKATMNRLYKRAQSVPTLYVKTLQNAYGPEYAVNLIFRLARQEAPCFLVFEDLDSMLSERIRSFFLNAVDGLAANDGILMMGSTNHLDLLDPGIAKRPSRFDRKFLFPNPDLKERTAYAKFWQKKLKENKDLEFPDRLCPAVAKITHGFSFAFMQEAFVATLLKIASDQDLESVGNDWSMVEELMLEDKDSESDESDQDKDLDQYILWREFKTQVKSLRDELDKEE